MFYEKKRYYELIINSFKVEKMKRIGILFLIVTLAGCVSAQENMRTKNRENLLHLSRGMQKFEVLQIMGTQTVKNINNPYMVETPLGKDGILYEVLFYHIETKKKDREITDEELVPIVFDEKNNLIGWGWTFLSELVPNYQHVIESH